MTFSYKDFDVTSTASLPTIVQVANAWVRENGVIVLNIETLTMKTRYEPSGIRVWYNRE